MTETSAPAGQPDWVAIRARYEAGVEKVADIAADCGLSRFTLALRAQKSGWKLRSSGKRIGNSSAKPETTKQILRRLKDVLQKGLHELDAHVAEPGAEGKTNGPERDIRAANTLVRTLEKVLELEHRDRKQHRKRNAGAEALDDAGREALARRIAQLCAERPGQGSGGDVDGGGGAVAALGLDLVGTDGPASA
jgi:hypothetical protein